MRLPLLPLRRRLLSLLKRLRRPRKLRRNTGLKHPSQQSMRTKLSLSLRKRRRKLTKRQLNL
jgi:hypothetical protein